MSIIDFISNITINPRRMIEIIQNPLIIYCPNPYKTAEIYAEHLLIDIMKKRFQNNYQRRIHEKNQAFEEVKKILTQKLYAQSKGTFISLLS